MIFFKDLEIRYVREIESRTEKKATLYLIMLVFTLVVFGYFGIVRGVVSLREKNRMIGEFDQIISNLNANLEKVSMLEPILQSEKVRVLHKSITTDPEHQNFMEEFVKVSSGNGYIVEKMDFNKTSGHENKIIAEASLRGSIDTAGDLLENFHQLERLVSVEKITITPISNRPNEYLLRISMYIYYVEK
jgi:hypothetical protein